MFAQGFEQILAEHDIAILPALATLHVDDTARTVDIREFEAGQLARRRSVAYREVLQASRVTVWYPAVDATEPPGTV
jgi:hypothetical protein